MKLVRKNKKKRKMKNKRKNTKKLKITKKNKRKTRILKMNKPFKVKSDFKVKLKKKPLKQYKQNADEVTYWIALVVITTCNLIAAMFLMPFLLILEQLPMYVLVVAIALVFGLLFNMIIRDINVEKHHHVMAVIFIPVITVINIFLMTVIANKLDIILNLNIQHSPLIVSLLYAVVFLLPYAVSIRKSK